MHCSVITPIGPGHEKLFTDCEKSLGQAVNFSMGPFAEIRHVTVDDTNGRHGRSAARNDGVKIALDGGADWLFFLDADDLLLPTAFASVNRFVESYSGIWGAIYELRAGSSIPNIRANQPPGPHSVDDLLEMDPFVSLQMGHFIRAEVALAHPFDIALDTGEDFDYYLRIWERYTCIKLPQPLFVNRRGNHSHGPRSASGGQWRKQVRDLFAASRKKRKTSSTIR